MTRAARLKSVLVPAALVAAGVTAALGIVEIGLRASGVFRPEGYDLLPPGAHVRDVQTQWDLWYDANDLGLRDDPVAPRPAPGVQRIAVVGDSFTFGQGCPRGAIFPDLLESELRAGGAVTEVVNVSRWGLSADGYAHLVRRVALPLRPGLVIVNVYGNDASSTDRPTRSQLFLRAAAERSHLVTLLRTVRRTHRGGDEPAQGAAGLARAVPPGDGRDVRAVALAAFRARYGPLPNNLVAALSANPHDVERGLLTPEIGPGWEVFQEAIASIAADCRSAGVPLVLGYVPDGAQVDPTQVELRRSFGVTVPADALVAPSRFETLAAGLAGRLAIPWFDPLPAFRADPSGLYFESDMHWTPRGHAVYARELAAFLFRGGFVADPPDVGSSSP